MKQLSLLLWGLVGIFNASSAQANIKHSTHLVSRFLVGGPGGWDYLAISPVKDWLYVSHSTRVNVLNKLTGDSVGVIENTTGVHGIAFDSLHGKGFTSNGKLNNVFVFRLENNKVTGAIATGQNPDAIMLEPYTGKIVTCNGRSNSLSVIDPVKEILEDSIALGGKPESAVSDGNGRLYVNIEDKNEIAVIDTKDWKVLFHWSIAPGEGPTGLAIDIVTNRLFVGCDEKLIVLNAKTGKVCDIIAIGGGCDGVAFDPATKNIYASNGIGTLSVIHEGEQGIFKLAETVKTKKGARTISLDIITHKIYLPAAEYEPLPAGQNGWPLVKAGTFQILVLQD